VPDWLLHAEHDSRTDIYALMQHQPDLLVKLRGGKRFQIKRRLARTGLLERWDMPFDAPLPLGGKDYNEINRHIGSQLQGADGQDKSRLLLALAYHGTRLFRLTKYRRQTRRHGVRIELTLVATGAGAVGTSIALEGSTAAPMLTAIMQLGVSAMANIDYGSWLTGLTDG
jgi:hypothetical protein